MAYFAIGAGFFAVGAVFFWLNNSSPAQTRIPAIALPIGAVLVLVGLGRILP
jgi:xanthosine utilization system XapX-like protein